MTISFDTVSAQAIELRKLERKFEKMSQQVLSGLYPGFPPFLPQNLQSMYSYMQPLLQQTCLFPSLAHLQQAALPPPYLANTGPGEINEAGSQETSRDRSISPSVTGMVISSGEQEEKEDYMAELAREKEVLVSRGMTREGSLLMRLLERGEQLTRNKNFLSFRNSILNSQRSACVSPAMLAPPWTRTGGCWTSTGRSPSG